MRFFLTAFTVLTAALRRLLANFWLVLCALLALTAAVALAVSVPVYAEGASLRLLNSEIGRQERQSARSPFTLLIRYIGAWNGPLEWEAVAGADSAITGSGIRSLQLPVQGVARHVRTDQMRLFLPPDAGGGQNQFVKSVPLGFLTGLDGQIMLVAGSRPRALTEKPSAQRPVEVLVSRALADEVGVNVGDRFTLVGAGSAPVSFPLLVSGIWQAKNAADPAWFFPPASFNDVLLTDEASFTGPVAGAMRREVAQVVWSARLNGNGLTAATAGPLLGRINALAARMGGFVPGLRLEQSPADALNRYATQAAQLTLQLAVFSTPILALVLYFVTLVAGMLVNRQRGEIALLKTRGVRDSQILGMYLVEWGLIGALALAIGPLVGVQFAIVMSRVTSFLTISDSVPPLAATLTWENGRFAFGAAALAVIAALVPALGATRRTLVDEQQQAARVARPPFWQRFYLDLLLLLPAVYGIYALRAGNGVFGSSGDPLANPLLLLVPVLLCFALGLVAVRCVPWLLELLTRLAARVSWIVPLVALRTLARQPGTYRGPLLLLILTLSLATFSTSMASALDAGLLGALTYQVGTPTQLIETGETKAPAKPGGPATPAPAAPAEPRFLFVPVSEHRKVPGVLAATRVGTYDAVIQGASAGKNTQLVGIDRADFPAVVNRFERGWAGGEPLGGLMNALAKTSDGLLVSRELLTRGVNVGDRVTALVTIAGDRREVSFRVIGTIDLWPGYYPQNGPIAVANLNYIFDSMSGQYPYDVWIARDPAVSVDAIVAGVRALGIRVLDRVDTAELIAAEQSRPQRQGLFGLLSVGFVAAGALTLLGFVLAGLVNARRRAIELGVLRALGMRGPQSGLILLIEQVTLVLAGIGCGSGIGALAATLVVPLFQVGVGAYPGTPPVVTDVALGAVAPIYAVFGVALLITLLALGAILGRMQLFQAVKLGDTN